MQAGFAGKPANAKLPHLLQKVWEWRSIAYDVLEVGQKDRHDEQVHCAVGKQLCDDISAQ